MSNIQKSIPNAKCGAAANGQQAHNRLLEMKDGDYAGVGPDITDEAVLAMLPGAGVGPQERVIRIPRQVLIAARAEIPAA
jgi:hypothetical protein